MHLILTITDRDAHPSYLFHDHSLGLCVCSRGADAHYATDAELSNADIEEMDRVRVFNRMQLHECSDTVCLHLATQSVNTSSACCRMIASFESPCVTHRNSGFEWVM